MIKLNKGIYYRNRIKTITDSFFTFEVCDEHGKIWKEGATYKDGACKKCIEAVEKR